MSPATQSYGPTYQSFAISPTPNAAASSRRFLHFFRLEFALYSENYLTPSRLKENEKQFRERLKAPGLSTAPKSSANRVSFVSTGSTNRHA